MIKRQLERKVIERLKLFPAVAVLGPRQVGKTTLARAVARAVARGGKSIYLDLESSTDREKLQNASEYLSTHEDKLVILDEVHRTPELFQELRGLIDRGIRHGRKSGRFLLLGSASMDLLMQSESLAGRIAYVELYPFNVMEVKEKKRDQLWLRGGFPKSFLSPNNKDSMLWRDNLITTYLERDIPQFGPRIPAVTLNRFWTMLAHSQGGILNAAQLAKSLSIDGKTVARYLDLMVDLLLVRRLQPYYINVRKRLVKSPKVYVRDTGVAHSLLGIGNSEQLLGHPISGSSWEGFVIENLLSVLPSHVPAFFYRSFTGAEIDLVFELAIGKCLAVEIKRSPAAKLGKGFYYALDDLKPTKSYVVSSGNDRYPIDRGIEAIGLKELMSIIAGL